MAHLWIRYLGFITGMIMAVLGSVFILGKLRDSEASKLGAETSALKVSLTSASPGALLAVLGSAMMVTTIIAQQETNVRDLSLYRPFAAEYKLVSEDNKSLPKVFEENYKTPAPVTEK
ncbi:hypothetical protein GCM10011348_15750 [Marinobacterium nitratireducens]|uniref:Uncharacterized protein n=2 Tax=Marinobacterium nitratireducens TaxID=518897 RepID=A0A917ZB85_9GAMM|nr:hypothetical protein GCM10011348_15750 [Marinobacterium nitratireducens]